MHEADELFSIHQQRYQPTAWYKSNYIKLQKGNFPAEPNRFIFSLCCYPYHGLCESVVIITIPKITAPKGSRIKLVDDYILRIIKSFSLYLDLVEIKAPGNYYDIQIGSRCVTEMYSSEFSETIPEGKVSLVLPWGYSKENIFPLKQCGSGNFVVHNIIIDPDIVETESGKIVSISKFDIDMFSIVTRATDAEMETINDTYKYYIENVHTITIPVPKKPTKRISIKFKEKHMVNKIYWGGCQILRTVLSEEFDLDGYHSASTIPLMHGQLIFPNIHFWKNDIRSQGIQKFPCGIDLNKKVFSIFLPEKQDSEIFIKLMYTKEILFTECPTSDSKRKKSVSIVKTEI